ALEWSAGRRRGGRGRVMLITHDRFGEGAWGPSAWYARQDTAEDGTFRMVTVPGPVILLGGANPEAEMARYKPSVADPQYPKYFTKQDGKTAFHGPGGLVMPLQGNFCKVLETKPGVEVVTQDVLLEPVP